MIELIMHNIYIIYHNMYVGVICTKKDVEGLFYTILISDAIKLWIMRIVRQFDNQSTN